MLARSVVSSTLRSSPLQHPPPHTTSLPRRLLMAISTPEARATSVATMVDRVDCDTCVAAVARDCSDASCASLLASWCIHVTRRSPRWHTGRCWRGQPAPGGTLDQRRWLSHLMLPRNVNSRPERVSTVALMAASMADCCWGTVVSNVVLRLATAAPSSKMEYCWTVERKKRTSFQ
jgi:hypothetical protein